MTITQVLALRAEAQCICCLLVQCVPPEVLQCRFAEHTAALWTFLGLENAIRALFCPLTSYACRIRVMHRTIALCRCPGQHVLHKGKVVGLWLMGN